MNKNERQLLGNAININYLKSKKLPNYRMNGRESIRSFRLNFVEFRNKKLITLFVMHHADKHTADSRLTMI